MSQEERADQPIGNVEVRLSSKAVHTAVRNIMANEMKLDPDVVRAEVQAKAFALVQEMVIDYLSKSGYDHTSLYDKVKRALDARLLDINRILKEVLETMIGRHIREQAIEVVAAVIEKGIEIRLDWNRKVTVKLTEAEPKPKKEEPHELLPEAGKTEPLGS